MGIYTDKAESALKKAQRFSARMHHPYTGTEHILMGLLDEPDSTAGQVLAGAGVTPKGLAEMIDQLIAPEGMVLTEERRGYTPRARKILDDAVTASGTGEFFLHGCLQWRMVRQQHAGRKLHVGQDFGAPKMRLPRRVAVRLRPGAA